MNSLALHNIATTAPKLFTNVSRRALSGSKCCMENFGEKKNQNLKLHSMKMNKGNCRVSIMEPVSAVTDVEESEVRTEEIEVSDGIGIVRFIKGKVFLITGATGFLAKVLVEKILRTVPDVGRIYLLMKAKDEKTAMQRIKTEIIDTELFKGLEQIYGKSYKEFILSKLVPAVGNLCEDNLGIEDNLANGIANEVDIIINSAANTTFDERLDVSLITNTLGPCWLLGFAKNCKKLKLFLHVSTAYVNGERQGRVMEKPFKLGDSIAKEKASSQGSPNSVPDLDVEAEIKKVLNAEGSFEDNRMSEKMKEMGLEKARTFGWHDTYTFTKAMGEMMIDSQRGEIPMVIIRPSTVESTFKEPIKGWIEGIRVLDPVIVYYAKGVLTGFPMDCNAVLDIVPVDMVVNAILAATVKHATVSKPGLSVYHVGSSFVNPLVFRDCFGYFFDYFGSSPYKDGKRGPINVQKMKLFDTMKEFNSHMEAEAVQQNPDGTKGSVLSRRLEMSLGIAKHLAKIYEPYLFYQGRFDNSNTQQLLEEMSEEEKISFGFDVRSIEWKEYMCNIHIPGLLTHSLKGRGL